MTITYSPEHNVSVMQSLIEAGAHIAYLGALIESQKQLIAIYEEKLGIDNNEDKS